MQEYDALIDKVDGHVAAIVGRCRTDMQCRAGCTACCQVSLSVSPVEAASLVRLLRRLPTDARAALRERATALIDRDGVLAAGPAPCVMLEQDGTCAVYAARPLICRTQGLPLRYPGGLIPAEAVRAVAAAPLGAGTGESAGPADGEVTWCPLNFTGPAPAARDVLDAGKVDALLALVNRRFADATGIDPLSRVALAALAGAEI